MINEKEIFTLYSLLDDPQEAVRVEVDRKILSFGEEVIDDLLRLDMQSGGINASRIAELSRTISRVTTGNRFTQFLADPRMDVDLEEGVFIITKFGYPQVDVDLYRMQLDEIARDIRRAAGARTSIGNLLLQLRTMLFSELGYTGNRKEYYDPDNTYFNRVLDRRIGIPITLSALMLLLGERLDLPMKGIGMPMHFLLQYDDGSKSFFIDAFNNGSMLTKDQCKTMMVRSGFTFDASMLTPVTNRYMIERMLRNLLFAYQQMRNAAELTAVTEFLLMFDPSYAPQSSEPELDDPMEDDE